MAMAHESTARIVKKRELKSEAILDAATQVLEAEGLDGLTLGRVAAAMGLVPGALYRYYDSKHALLAGLQRRAIAQIGEEVQAALGRLPQTPAEDVAALARLLAVARAYGALPATAPRAWHLVSVMLAEPKPLLSAQEAAVSFGILGALLEQVVGALDAAQVGKALAKGDSAARTLAFWGAVHGAAALSKLKLWAPQLPEAPAAALEAATGLLLGWGAKPQVLEQAKKLAAKGAR